MEEKRDFEFILGKKVPVGLIPTEALEAVARTMAAGYKKRGGATWHREPMLMHLNAMMRHYARFMAGEVRDQDDGSYHLAAIAVRALLAFAVARRGGSLEVPMTPDRASVQFMEEVDIHLHGHDPRPLPEETLTRNRGVESDATPPQPPGA